MKTRKNFQPFDFYCILFFLLSFAGWAWEVMLYLFTEHAFINRGVYHGPYLPIYGVGGMLLCMLLGRFRKKPWLVFGLSLLLCSLLEYGTSWFLEAKWGLRWWDYSGHFLNIGGRICLLGAVTFGLFGMALVSFFLPFYEKIYLKIPKKIRMLFCVAAVLIFAADAAYAAIRPNMGKDISR